MSTVLFVGTNNGILFLKRFTGIYGYIVGAISTATTVTGDLIRFVVITEIISRVSAIIQVFKRNSKID